MRPGGSEPWLTQRQQAWLSARQLTLLSLISACDSSQRHWCVEEIGCALGLSGPAAQLGATTTAGVNGLAANIRPAKVR